MTIYRHEQSAEEKSRSKRGRRNRRKGHDFERKIVRRLNAILPPAYYAKKREQGKGGWHESEVGVYLKSDDTQVLHAECKHHAHVRPSTVKSAQIQADHDAPPGVEVIVIAKQDRQPEQVWIRASYGWPDEPVTMDQFEAALVKTLEVL